MLHFDDAVKEDYLECLYENAVKYNADVVVASYYRYVEEENKYYFVVLEQGYEVKTFTGQEVYQNYYSLVNGYNVAFVVAWGKLFMLISICTCIARGQIVLCHPSGREKD